MKKLFTLAAAAIMALGAMAETVTFTASEFASETTKTTDGVTVTLAANITVNSQQTWKNGSSGVKEQVIQIGNSANQNQDVYYVEITSDAAITGVRFKACHNQSGATTTYNFPVVSWEDTPAAAFDGVSVLTAPGKEATSAPEFIDYTPCTNAHAVRAYRTIRVNADQTAFAGSNYTTLGDGKTIYISEIEVETGVAVTKYTVSYYDGANLLATEKVAEGSAPAKYADYQAKPRYTFDGWFNDAALTNAADMSATISADKAFYGKWTAEPITYSSSINIEQGVLNNGKGWNFTADLAAAHIAYDPKGNTDELDSLNASKTSNNEPYLGLKLKKKDAYLEVGLHAGDVLRVKLGAIAADFKVAVDGVESTIATSAANTVYELTATKDEYVRFFIATNDKTTVFKQIMINESIAPVALPGNETNTKLASLTLDGVAIAGFAADKTTYNITLGADATAAPVVAATAEGAGAIVSEITQATAIPGAATFTVTAADGTTTATYTINFSSLRGEKALTNVRFSNGAYGAIDEAAHTITVAYMGEMPTVDATSIVVSEAATAAVNGTTLTVTAEDASTQDYTIVGQELVASATVDTEITFDGTETTYIYAHYGWDPEKGVKFSKDVDEASNMRIAKGNSRIYMALPAAANVELTSGTGGARGVKISVNGVESEVNKTAKANETVTITLDPTAETFVIIESNGNSGDGGFIKMKLNSTVATGLENISSEKVEKLFINGQLFIIKNGVRYNAQGQIVK